MPVAYIHLFDFCLLFSILLHLLYILNKALFVKYCIKRMHLETDKAKTQTPLE